MSNPLQLNKVIEALLFASDEPLTMKRLRYLLSDYGSPEEGAEEVTEPQEIEVQISSKEEIDTAEVSVEPAKKSRRYTTDIRQFEEAVQVAISDIKTKYASPDSPVVVLEVAGGWQLATNPVFSPWVKKLFKHKINFRLSQAALETMAIIAYRQPITRAEIEQIRGVEVIASLETLLERGLVKVDGRKETVGRPLLYATSDEFLRQFGLHTLNDLPPLEAAPAAVSQTETPEPENE